jgi:hypothetical protein
MLRPDTPPPFPCEMHRATWPGSRQSSRHLQRWAGAHSVRVASARSASSSAIECSPPPCSFRAHATLAQRPRLWSDRRDFVVWSYPTPVGWRRRDGVAGCPPSGTRAPRGPISGHSGPLRRSPVSPPALLADVCTVDVPAQPGSLAPRGPPHDRSSPGGAGTSEQPRRLNGMALCGLVRFRYRHPGPERQRCAVMS